MADDPRDGSRLTHVREDGSAHMVDVSAKAVTAREASAAGRVLLSPAAVAALRAGEVPKGDALAVARIAGIQAAKRTPELIPLAHPIAVHAVSVDLTVGDDGVDIAATVRTADRTGIEMEALTCVSVAALALVDMVKAVDKHARITDIRVTAGSRHHLLDARSGGDLPRPWGSAHRRHAPGVGVCGRCRRRRAGWTGGGGGPRGGTRRGPRPAADDRGHGPDPHGRDARGDLTADRPPRAGHRRGHSGGGGGQGRAHGDALERVVGARRGDSHRQPPRVQWRSA